MNQRHFHVGRLDGAADHVECAQMHRLEVLIPFASLQHDYEALSLAPAVRGLQELAVGAVGDPLVAEDQREWLAGKNFAGLS